MMKKILVVVLTLWAIVWPNWVYSTGTLDQVSVRPPLTTGTSGRPRSEIDLETEKSVIICAGQNKSLECFSPGSSISIKNAFWGRISADICPSEDGDPVTNCQNEPTTTPIVQNLCDDKEYCEVPARHSVLQPPGTKHCPGVNKYLSIKYACMPQKRKFVLCDGETTELQCGEGWKVHIISAYWGRDSPSTCPTPLGKFFTCANSADSLMALRERCMGKESCWIKADDEHMTNHKSQCPGVDKYAVITYNCQLHGHHSDAKKVIDLLKEGPENDQLTSADLTVGSKSRSAAEATLGKDNTNVLLPVPQYNASDTVKPIIEFLGEDTSEENATSENGKPSVLQDTHPTLPKKGKFGSIIQDGVRPSMFSNQNGISAALSLLSDEKDLNPGGVSAVSDTSKQKPLSVENHTTLVESSVQRKLAPPYSSLLASRPSKGTFQASHVPSVSGNALPVQRLPSTPTHPLRSITQSLLEDLLASKFGQRLGNILLNSFASLQTPLNKNSIGNNQAPKASHSSVQDGQSPPNKGLISNIISGLIHQPSSSSEGKTSTASESNKTTVQPPIKSSSLDSLPWPTISIRENTFSMGGLSDLFKGEHDHKPGSQNGVNVLRGPFTEGKSEGMPSTKKHNEDKIRQLNEKIKRLETLSDALDALTSQLSTEDKRLDKNSNKDEDIALNSNRVNKHVRRYRKYHTHHPKSHQFDEDFSILVPLLSSTEKYGKMDRRTPNFSEDKKDTNYITEVRKQNTFNGADVETLQRKINNAIEKAETSGRQEKPNRVGSEWLPLSVVGQVDKDVGAQTRQKVTRIALNHTATKGNLVQRKSEIETLQEILKSLIGNALRKGTLNQLIQRWNESGSPFVGIARNISSMLFGNGNMTKRLDSAAGKLTVSNISLKNFQTTAKKESLGLSYESALNQKTNTTSVRMKSQNTQPSAVGNLTKDDLLFKEAVNGIITILKKHYGLLGNTSNSSWPLFSTDTLTRVKGITLGGRINDDVSATTNRMPGLKANILPQTLGGQTQRTTPDTKDNASKSLGLGVQTNASGIYRTQNDHLPTLVETLNRTSQNNLTVINKTDQLQRKFSNTTTVEKNNSANKTLMEFMESIEGAGGHKLMLNYTAPKVSLGYKHSKVKPRLRYLIAAVAQTLMDLAQIKEKRPQKEPKIKYDVSGVSPQLITTLPNDHTSGDLSYADAILEAPNDHAELKRINNNSIPRRMFSLTQSPSFTAKNKGTKLQTENNKLDSSETVTVTLETVNDKPTDPPLKLSPARDTSDIKSPSRSTKIPHNTNIQSAVTLGKINRTSADNGENSVPLSQVNQVPAVMSSNTTESSQQMTAMPSDGNLNPISPIDDFSTSRREEHQTKAKPQIPLASQMDKIGRMAETAPNNQPPETLTSTSGIHELVSSADASASLAAKSGWVQIPDDKLLPMTSDSTSAMTAKKGETEGIVSKGGPLTTQPTLAASHHLDSFNAPAKSELPTNLEVKEISRSVHALLKILSNYSHKLKMEEDKNPGAKGGIDRTENLSATIGNRENFHDDKVNDEDKRIHIKFNDSGLNGQLNPWSSRQNEQTSRYATNTNNNKGLGQTFSYPQTTPTLANYVDTGMFENIREQSEPEVNTYKWNRFVAPVQLHAQVQEDSNPTKDSFSPQQNAHNTQANLDSSLTGVPEELQDENIPSIEDDPTVKAVQKIVAEENAFESDKRKEILKHQPIAGQQSQPRHKSDVFGRNIILNKNNKKHPDNASREGKSLKASYKNISYDTRIAVHAKQENSFFRKSVMRSRHTIPRAKVSSVPRKNTLLHLKKKNLNKNNYTRPSTGHHNPPIADYNRKIIRRTKPTSKHIPGITSQYKDNKDKVPRRNLKQRQGTFHNVVSFVHANTSDTHLNASLQGTSTGDVAKVHKQNQGGTISAAEILAKQNVTTNAKTDNTKRLDTAKLLDGIYSRQKNETDHDRKRTQDKEDKKELHN